jgi:Rad3-related DNA helicase
MSFRSPEQQHYADLINAVLQPGPPLLAGAAPGLGKTHGYSIPLVSSGLRVAIAMSTRQLIDQYLSSAALQAAVQGKPISVVALQTRHSFDNPQAYQAHREQALAAQVLVLTHAAALVDSLQPGYAQLRERDVVLFDEADLLADAAELRSTFRLGSGILQGCGAAGLSPQAAATLALQAPNLEDRCAARAILSALERPAFYKVVGFEDDGALVLKHRMPGRMLKPLVQAAKRCIFTSGTLQVQGRFDHFTRALGLTHIAPESRHIDPSHHGKLKIHLAPDTLDTAAMAQSIAKALRPALVLTNSHDMSQQLAQHLPEAVVRGPQEPLADAVQRCPDDGLLIAAGAWSGLDAPRLRWQTVVIPQTPYGPPVQVDGQQLTSYLDSTVVALRRTHQGLHRGLRTPDAVCTLLLLDPRSARPALREAIPQRFQPDWAMFEEGGAVLQIHLKRERHAQLRKAALKHHGMRCMHPACEVNAEHQLDVNHTRPISQGERRTTLDEVVVLCKNHHAQAHFDLKMAAFLKAESAENQITAML